MNAVARGEGVAASGDKQNEGKESRHVADGRRLDRHAQAGREAGRQKLRRLTTQLSAVRVNAVVE